MGVTKVRNRITGIDILRLLAASCVISLHVGYFHALGEYIGMTVRLLARWAVPFFWLVTGYFLSKKNDDKYRTVKPILRLVIVFVVASILFIPLDIEEKGLVEAIAYCLNSDLLFRGTYGHLWFISSTILGLLFVLLSDGLRLKVLLPAAATISLTLYLILGAYNPFESLGTVSIARHFASIAFIYMGMLLSTRKLKMNFSWLLVAVGIALQFIEAYALSQIMGKDPAEQRLLIGTIPYCIGMFGIGLNIRGEKALTGMLSAVGRKYSLGVYIIHPYLIWLSYGILLNILKLPISIAQMLIVPCALLSSIICLAFADLYLKPLFLLIDGDPEMITKIDAKLSRSLGQ